MDFFSNKLRLALDTLTGLAFAVASERVFFPGLAEVFFRLGVGFLLFIGSAVGVENSALDVSRMSVELLLVSRGGRLGEAEHWVGRNWAEHWGGRKMSDYVGHLIGGQFIDFYNQQNIHNYFRYANYSHLLVVFIVQKVFPRIICICSQCRV